MKKTILSFAVFFFVLFLAGCQENGVKGKPDHACINGKGKIPEIMAGVWDTEDANIPWAFKIEPDGSISKINHPVAGRVVIQEGGYYVDGPDPGTYAFFIMGPCESSFDASSGIFIVHIILSEFTMRLPQGEIKGQSDDYFKGAVSNDGKTWNAKWFNYSSLEGGGPPDVNTIDANPIEIIFKTADLKKPEPNEEPKSQ
jgi:hypothetical protein